jgi:hypothetical protein
MLKREVVADWIQIISAPLTVLSVYWAWSDRIKNATAASLVSPTFTLAPYAIAISLIATVWVFFFSVFVRLLRGWAKAKTDAVYLFSLIALIMGLALFIPVELLLLEASLPQTPSELGLFVWLAVPASLWILTTGLAFLIAGSQDGL